MKDSEIVKKLLIDHPQTLIDILGGQVLIGYHTDRHAFLYAKTDFKQVTQHVIEGNRVSAIKLHRTSRDLGLRDARDQILNLEGALKRDGLM